MNKTTRSLVLILLLGLIFVLNGCRRATDDSNNKYRLPLGDSGYLTEMDFPLYKNATINEEGNETINYDFVTNEEYIVKVNAKIMDEKQNGKAISLKSGYYNENNEFVKNDDGATFLLNSEDFTPNTYVFTLTNEALANKEKVVIKLLLGTSVDEEYFKTQNPDFTKKELRKYLKTYRASSIKINELTLTSSSISDNLLVEESTQGGESANVYGKVNSDLYYYNTAVVEYASETLTITLNNKSGWWQWIIAELGKLLFFLTGLVGGRYWLALLIFTLVLRTIGWPIYAKSNSFTSNMSKLQPEMEKLNKKYEGKTDQNSKMKQQMEMRELMKKNHVSMWGCLLPFAQMPIFFAVYQVVQRFPLTPIYQNVNYKFLWTTFAMDYGKASGDWILAIIVGLTMIGSQLISTYMTKRIQRKNTNFYTAKSQSGNKQMLIMMVVMTAMMVAFAWSSAGIAFYWIIGNTYQIAQTMISKIQEEKRTEKDLIKTGRVRGRN